jgi:outer membrane protein assembly factor BamB
MENPVKKALVGMAMVASLASVCVAADWPQFLGLDRTGVSKETGLAKTWPKDGPKVLWSFDLGEGYGPAAIEGGKVYVLDRVANKQDVLRCVDLTTGKEDWNFAYDAPGKSDYNGSRSTPTVDDKYVYTVGPFGQAYCVDKATHKEVWKLDLLAAYGSKVPQWAMSQSPVVYKDWVILAPQSGKAGVVALEKATGKEVWKSPSVGGMAYCTPMVVTLEGVDQIVMESGDRTAGLDAKTGALLWSFNGWKCGIPCPSPTYCGEGRFFLTGGYNAGSAMFKVAKDGDKWTATKLWDEKTVGSHLQNGLLYKDHLYINGNNTKAGLTCMDLDGKVLWKSGEKDGIEMGNIIIADGLIFGLNGGNGALSIYEAAPEAFKQISTTTPFKGPTAWSPMALSDGKLVARDQKQMKCFDVKAEAK